MSKNNLYLSGIDNYSEIQTFQGQGHSDMINN